MLMCSPPSGLFYIETAGAYIIQEKNASYRPGPEREQSWSQMRPRMTAGFFFRGSKAIHIHSVVNVKRVSHSSGSHKATQRRTGLDSQVHLASKLASKFVGLLGKGKKENGASMPRVL